MLLDGILDDVLGEFTGQGAKFAPFSPPFAHAQTRMDSSFSPFSPLSPAMPAKSLSPAPAKAFALVREWLKSIGEQDAAVINDVVANCRADAEVLRYYTARASEPLPDHPPPDASDLAHGDEVARLVDGGWCWHHGRWFAPGTWKPEEPRPTEPPAHHPEPPRASTGGTGGGHVACGSCANFIRDTIGDGSGIGRCAKLADPPSGLLYPRIERRCRDFRDFEAITKEGNP
jgi:hypothetical protein